METQLAERSWAQCVVLDGPFGIERGCMNCQWNGNDGRCTSFDTVALIPIFCCLWNKQPYGYTMDKYLGDTEILDVDAMLGIQRDEPCSLRSHIPCFEIHHFNVFFIFRSLVVIYLGITQFKSGRRRLLRLNEGKIFTEKIRV
jgi:hypothetical protein